MKNVLKVFGNLNRDRRSKVPLLIIAFVAVIGFSMAACDDGGGDDGGGGGGGSGGDSMTGGSFTVYDQATWNEAVNSIKARGNNKTHTIEVTADFSIPGTSYTNTFGSVTGITVTITGDHEITLASGSNGNLLWLGANQSVAITDLKLKGHSGNTISLVRVGSATAAFTMSGNASVSKNHASSGGGVSVDGGTFTMSDSASVSGNTTTSSGGGVFVYSGGTFTMSGSASVSDNTAHNGGGVYVGSGVTFTMSGSASVSDNLASSGGGVYVNGGTFTMSDNATVSGNTATSNTGGGGGGVYVDIFSSGIFTMSGNASVSGNTTTGNGGGVFVCDTFTMSDNASVSGNTASSGGGVYVRNGGIFTMTGGTVSGNTATGSGGRGGGVYVYGITASGYVSVGTFRIVSGTVYGSDESDTNLKNTATNGAALYKETGTFVIPIIAQHGTFDGDTWTSKGDLNTTNSTIKVVDGEIVP